MQIPGRKALPASASVGGRLGSWVPPAPGENTPRAAPGPARAGEDPALNSRFHPDLPAFYQRPAAAPPEVSLLPDTLNYAT